MVLMEGDPTMRYVGFTTVTSSTHKSQLRNRYSVTCLNDLAVENGVLRDFGIAPAAA